MNAYEKERYEELKRKGYKVFYRGYPDFLIYNPKTDKVSFEECKFASDKVSPEQEQMHYYLSKATGHKVNIHYLYPHLDLRKPRQKTKKEAAPKAKKMSLKQDWLNIIARILEREKANMTTGSIEDKIRTLHPQKIAHIKNLHGSIGSALDRARKGKHPDIKCQKMPNGKFEYWFVRTETPL